MKPQLAKQDYEFRDYVLDQLANVRGLTSRNMFGGWGFYSEGVFFGLIAEGRLFFFVDDLTRPRYEAEGSKPFTYSRDGESVTMSYYEVPEDVLERADEAAEWAHQAAVAKSAVPKKKPASKASGKRKTRQ